MISAEDKQNLVVGFKQVLKAAKTDACSKIFIAEDCDNGIKDSLKCVAGEISVITVPTMRELGNMCGIDVSASCAAVRK